MLVLNILIALGVIVVVFVVILLISKLITLINEYFQDRFDYNFIRMSCVMLVAAVLTLIGLYWYNGAASNGGDVLNGLILMVIGGMIAIGLVSYTIWKTNLIYAILIILLQLGISPLLIVFFIILAGLKVLSALLSPIAQPVYIVDRD